MQLDKFMMMDGMLPFDDGDPRIDEWCRVWSKPVNLSLFDTVRMSEQECSDMLPQIETMKYGGSDLMLSPALEEFVLHMTGTNEQGVQGYNDILFKKSVIRDTKVKKTDHGTMTLMPVLDAYFFFGNKKIADAVIGIGAFRMETDEGKYCTGTFQYPIWVKARSLLQDDYLIEHFRYAKLEYLLIQKALYDRPEVFVETKNR